LKIPSIYGFLSPTGHPTYHCHLTRGVSYALNKLEVLGVQDFGLEEKILRFTAPTAALTYNPKYKILQYLSDHIRYLADI
jgi:hypothetical protein